MSNTNLNDFYSLDWDIQYDYLLDERILNKVAKFHQSTTFTYSETDKPNLISKDLYFWLIAHERKQTIPSVYLEEVKLIDTPLEKRNSPMNFDIEHIIPFDFFSKIVQQSFGANLDTLNLNRSYPSAGALYTINSIVYIFDHKKVEGIVQNGAYFYNAYKNSLLLIQNWDDEKLRKVRGSISGHEFLSQIAIGYSIDIRKSIIKYRTRGYRHAFIEIGLMAQRFREVLLKYSNGEYGERCWSGFSDNSFTYLSGLNVRLSPVGLLQWFGKRVEET
ncbi:MAG: hypothetical protein LKH79_23800 [Heyndrickxia oleronia]|jgi:SagB-type dehydrogenase family enzyme|uniref:hypothetical protein n=1 Tax=Heyndrickxia oleronia TaxID=38875 RepID=UPI00242B0D96|nr:hypothetical protein [Heyndrickxia oleronia]MCI1593502.1 hypothetical protein [Heyndrickxia oleronia]